MSTLVIMYSNGEISNYIERTQVEDNAKTLVKAAEIVAASGPGSAKVIQLDMPRGLSQGYVSGNEVIFKQYTEGDYLSDVHFPMIPRAYGLLEPEKGNKYFVLVAQPNGYVAVSPLSSPNMMSHVFAYYNMEFRNSTHVLELSGKSPHALIVNADCDVDGHLGKGCRMNATNKYLLVSSFNMSYEEFSYAIWFKPETSDRRIIDQTWNTGTCSASNDGVIVAEFMGGKFNTAFCNTSNSVTQLNGTKTLASDNWHHAIVTFKDGRFITYVDGSLDTTTSYSTVPRRTARNLFIGSTGSNTFIGTIDEVIFFDIALNADEARALYFLGGNQQ